jgi:YggT family protein
MQLFVTFVSMLATILSLAIFVRSILTWFPGASDNLFGVILAQITDPVLVPLRRIVPTIGMIDITPLVAILLLQFIAVALQSAFIV